MSNALLTKANDYIDVAAKLSGAHNYAEALNELNKAEEIFNRMNADSRDVQKLVARCCLAKGALLWTVGEEDNLIGSNLEMMLSVASTTLRYCEKDSDMHVTWAKRVAGLCGAIIDNSGHVSYEMASSYVIRNILFFVDGFSFDKSVTVERALRCVDLMKNLTQDKMAIVLAQWLAGCAMLLIGKNADKIRAVSLVTDACEYIKTARKSDWGLVAIGSGVVAKHYFEKGEYELAEQWYQTALKYANMVTKAVYSVYSKLYSEKIEECKKRMQ
ncbi:MAG: hypothetical protein LBT59_17445 [Clostridiales bacterium]|nr:hypothetical protein [Clostridiales bacterium]